jgi:hypothetical protein
MRFADGLEILNVFSSVADPDPGPGAWIRDGKKSRSGSGMNIPDHISESIETIFWGKHT